MWWSRTNEVKSSKKKKIIKENPKNNTVYFRYCIYTIDSIDDTGYSISKDQLHSCFTKKKKNYCQKWHKMNAMFPKFLIPNVKCDCVHIIFALKRCQKQQRQTCHVNDSRLKLWSRSVCAMYFSMYADVPLVAISRNMISTNLCLFVEHRRRFVFRVCVVPFEHSAHSTLNIPHYVPCRTNVTHIVC